MLRGKKNGAKYSNWFLSTVPNLIMISWVELLANVLFERSVVACVKV